MVVWLLLVLQGKASLLLSTCYRQARFMIQPFFFLRKQDLLIFEVLRGMAVIHDAGSSVFKKLISDFNVSLVDVNISGRKETGRGECYRKELFTHTQRIELILWLGSFIHYLAFIEQLSACLCTLSMFSHPNSLYILSCRVTEKKRKKKSLQIFSSGSLRVFCAIS